MAAGSILGLSLSLLNAFLWAVVSMCWSSAGRRIGSFNLCVLRCLLAALVLLLCLPVYFIWHPVAAPVAGQWLWLVLSGASGMVLGDILSFEAYVRMGARRTSQIMLMAPVAAVISAWLCLGETPSKLALWGIAIIIPALAYVMLTEKSVNGGESRDPGRISQAGVLLAFSGAVFVGFGAVLGRKAFLSGPPLDMIMATGMRVCSAAALLWVISAFRGSASVLHNHLRDQHAFSRLALGTASGPLLGMFCYIGALKSVNAGVVSTLSAMSVLFVILLAALRHRARPRAGMVLGTLAALAGVALLFWE